jgi:hypothetical protein
MLQVTEAADDLNLLSLPELRAATGVSTGYTSGLQALGLRVAAMIAASCMVVSDAVNPPTFRLEGSKETLRLDHFPAKITLSRRPVVGITSLTEAGTPLTRDTDYEVDPASGQLTRLRGDRQSCWTCGKIVVEYTAGYECVPEGPEGDRGSARRRLLG